MTNRIRVSDELDRAPNPADLGDYKMLLDDLAASIQIIADELPAPIDPAPASAQHLADADFPLAIGEAMRAPTGRATPNSRPGEPPGPRATPVL
jgi:hypothetical protein